MTIKLVSERKKRGMSQYQLSRMTGIHPSDISKMESGRFPCFDGWKKRIAEALEWPADQIDELFMQE
jgi:transcriptional regulator with XRE-family HTH domain